MSVALWVLFGLALMPYLLAGLGGAAKAKQFGRLDTRHPRVQSQQATGVAARLVAAQSNAWEALGFFTVCVVISYLAGVEPVRLDLPAILFALTRLLHPIFYAANWALLRSLIVVFGLACGISMVLMAA